MTKPVRKRREQIRRAQRTYRRNNAAKLRADTKARDARNPEGKRLRLERFEAANPTYWREYYHRRKFRVAWQRFAKACAETRARHDPSRPVGVG